MVLLTISPIFATSNHNDCSPESEIIIGRVASIDLIKATSFAKKSLPYQGHWPNLNNGSFSACQETMAFESLYRVTTSLIYLSNASCCSCFERVSVQAGK